MKATGFATSNAR